MCENRVGWCSSHFLPTSGSSGYKVCAVATNIQKPSTYTCSVFHVLCVACSSIKRYAYQTLKFMLWKKIWELGIRLCYLNEDLFSCNQD